MNKFAKKPAEDMTPVKAAKPAAVKADKPVAVKAATVKPVAVKAEKPAAAKPAKAAKDLSTQKITLLTKENPKRGGAATRFSLYKSGMTVADYVAAGGKVQDVAWDSKKGYIKVA